MKKKLKIILSLTFACFIILGQAVVVCAEGSATVKQIRTDLNSLISWGVTATWAPDVRAHQKEINDMVESFNTLTAAEKSEFSEKELTNLKAYFTTHFKNEGIDSTLLTDMFDITKDNKPASGGDASSQASSQASSAVSSQDEPKPVSSEASSVVSSDVSSTVSSETSSVVSSEVSSAMSSVVSSETSSPPPSSKEESSSDMEDKPAIGNISSQASSSSSITDLPKATPSSDIGANLLICLIVVAAIGIIIAIWYMFFKKPSKPEASSQAHSPDDNAWFINYVKNEDNSAEDAEKKIEEAINALRNSNKNDVE